MSFQKVAPLVRQMLWTHNLNIRHFWLAKYDLEIICS